MTVEAKVRVRARSEEVRLLALNMEDVVMGP